jgi:hypothetical protein
VSVVGSKRVPDLEGVGLGGRKAERGAGQLPGPDRVLERTFARTKCMDRLPVSEDEGLIDPVSGTRPEPWLAPTLRRLARWSGHARILT